MGYMHIENLYKARDILLFKECYALEKIHGTSAHISWNINEAKFFSGSTSYVNFVKLFDIKNLEKVFADLGHEKIKVYGEAHGGKIQGMSDTYGKDTKFVVFDINIDGLWLDVPNAEKVTNELGLEFVHYDLISATPEVIESIILEDSVQAVRNGMGTGHKREGVVLRPPIEIRKNNGDRVIAKHKNLKFRETKTPRKLSQEELAVLENAKEIAEEWVTYIRLTHVLDKFEQPWDISDTREVIKAMIEDVIRESTGEIIDSKEVRTAIGRKTASLFKDRLKI